MKANTNQIAETRHDMTRFPKENLRKMKENIKTNFRKTSRTDKDPLGKPWGNEGKHKNKQQKQDTK